MNALSLVKSLLSVHEFIGLLVEYELLLSRAVSDLLLYLKCSNTRDTLHVSSKDLSDSLEFCYDSVPHHLSISFSDIHAALEHPSLGGYSSKNSLSHDLDTVLDDSRFRFITLKLQSLIDFINEIHDLSDLKLIMILSKSFDSAVAASSLSKPLSPSAIHRPPRRGHDHLVEFHCDNTTLSTIHRYFLDQINQDPSVDPNQCAELLLALFKHFSGASSLTLSDFPTMELTFQKFQEFFLHGDTTNDPPLLPSRFNDVNQKMILDAHFLHHGSTGKPSCTTSDTTPTTLLEECDRSNTVPTAVLVDYKPSDTTPPPISIQFKSSDKSLTSRPSNSDASLLPRLRELALEFSKYDHNFDIRFVRVFEIYMGLFHSDWHCFATVHDREYLNDMDHYIHYLAEDASINDEDRDLELLSIKFFFEMHLLLLSRSSQSSTLLMRASLFLYDRDARTRLWAFRIWNKQEIRIANLISTSQTLDLISLHDKRLKNRVFTNWIHSSRRIQEIESAVDAECANSALQFALGKWLQKLVMVKHLNIIESKYTKKRFLDCWSMITADHRSHMLFAAQYHRQKLLQGTFSRIRERSVKSQQLDRDADRFRSVIKKTQSTRLMRKTFKSWYLKMDRKYDVECLDKNGSPLTNSSSNIVFLAPKNDQGLAHKLVSLKEMERVLILRQYHERWLKAYSLVNIESQLQSQQDDRMRRYYFKSIWQKRTLQLQALLEFLARQDSILMERRFLQWSNYAKNIVIARLVYSKHLLQSSFNKWKLGTKYRLWESRDTDRRLSAANFKGWILAYRRRTFDRAKLSQIKQKWFKSWRERGMHHKESLLCAIAFQHKNIKRAMLFKWTVRLARVRQLKESADHLLKRETLHRIIDRYETIITNMKLANKMLEQQWSNRFDALVCLRIWTRSWLARNQKKLDDLALVFDENVSIPHAKRRALERWKMKLDGSRSRLERLEKLLTIYSIASTYPFLRIWRQKLQYVQDLELTGLEMMRSILLKKALIVWYSKETRLNDLKDKWMDFEASREINLCSIILKSWSRRTTNIRTRNRQSYAAFRERRESATTRTFFLLWIYQLEQRQTRREPILDDVDERDASSISDTSPLANKSSRLSTSSFLSTPVKEHVSPVRYSTPHVLPSSPSRLSQSTQRMRMERILAQKEHLKSARTSPRRSNIRLTLSATIGPETYPVSDLVNVGKGPLMGEDTNNRFIRLPPPSNSSSLPPRRNDLRVNMNMATPPAPPNFATVRPVKSRDPIAELPPITRHASRSVEPVSLGEETDIATAKRMKKITPIVMPPFEEDQLRFSPASKIRERLLAQSDI